MSKTILMDTRECPSKRAICGKCLAWWACYEPSAQVYRCGGCIAQYREQEENNRMADIRKAAEWISWGFVVRRASWPPYQGPWDGLRYNTYEKNNRLMGHVGLHLDDLLAEDWEIATSTV